MNPTREPQLQLMLPVILADFLLRRDHRLSRADDSTGFITTGYCIDAPCTMPSGSTLSALAHTCGHWLIRREPDNHAINYGGEQ